jgi:hypothetical protein
MPFFALPARYEIKSTASHYVQLRGRPEGSRKPLRSLGFWSPLADETEDTEYWGNPATHIRYDMCVEEVTIRIPRDLSHKIDESKESMPGLAHQYFWFCRGC